MQLEDTTHQFDQLLREGRFSDAVALCDGTLSLRLTPAQRCLVLRLKAEALLADRQGWQGRAIGCLKEALSLAKPGSHTRAKVLVAMTAAYAAIASVGLCREARDAFLQILEKNQAERFARLRPHAEYNLGLAHHGLDQLEEAEDCYFAALEACTGFTDPLTLSVKFKINHNLIDVFQERGRHQDAEAIMSSVYRNADDAVYGAQMRNRRALQALAAEDFDSAVLWVESGLGHPSCDKRTRAALLLTKARIAHSLGESETAKEYAAKAIALAQETESNRLVARALRFLEQVPKGG